MTASERPRIRVANAGDLIAVVPCLVGFHPQDSLVAIALRGSRVTTSVRLDLPASAADPSQLPEIAGRVAATFTRGGATGALLIGYGNPGEVASAVQAVTSALHDTAIPVTEALRVTDGRFYSLTCTDPACCPAGGTPFDAATSRVAADATVKGLVALPDRQALATTIDPITGPARDAMAAATLTAVKSIIELLDAETPDGADEPDTSPNTPLGGALLRAGRTYLTTLQHQHQAGNPLDDEQAAHLTVLLELESVGEMAARRTTGERWQLQFWTDLTRRAAPPFTCAPATVLALAAAQAGDGALAAIAIQRAIDADPGNRLAALVATMIAADVEPATMTAFLRPAAQPDSQATTGPAQGHADPQFGNS